MAEVEVNVSVSKDDDDKDEEEVYSDPNGDFDWNLFYFCF